MVCPEIWVFFCLGLILVPLDVIWCSRHIVVLNLGKKGVSDFVSQLTSFQDWWKPSIDIDNHLKIIHIVQNSFRAIMLSRFQHANVMIRTMVIARWNDNIITWWLWQMMMTQYDIAYHHRVIMLSPCHRGIAYASWQCDNTMAKLPIFNESYLLG